MLFKCKRTCSIQIPFKANEIPESCNGVIENDVHVPSVYFVNGLRYMSALVSHYVKHSKAFNTLRQVAIVPKCGSRIVKSRGPNWSYSQGKLMNGELETVND